MALHVELERRLAAFKHTEAAVVFQSGFAANAGTVAAILDAKTTRRLRRAEPRQHHRRLPSEPRHDQGVSAQGRRRGARRSSRGCRATSASCSSPTASSAWTATSGRCRSCATLAEEFGCIMMVDDAHASGVFGRNGRGTVDHFGLHGRVDSRSARCRRRSARSAATSPGRERYRLPAPPRAAVPVLDVASAVGGGHLPGGARRAASRSRRSSNRLWDNTRFFKAGLAALGFDTGVSESPITPVIVGDGALAMTLSDRLFEEGVFAQGIAFPTVRAGQGARPHHRHRHAHAGRAAVRARLLQEGRHASWASSDRMARSRRSVRLQPSAGANPAGPGLLRALHAGPARPRSAAAVHARHGRRLPLLLAPHRRRRARAAAVVPAVRRVRAAGVPGVHDAPDPGAPRALRRRASSWR